jgi:hypothetical protein
VRASNLTQHRRHTYVGTRIPWFVRLMWVAFWIFAIAYVIHYLLSALQHELTSPP